MTRTWIFKVLNKANTRATQPYIKVLSPKGGCRKIFVNKGSWRGNRDMVALVSRLKKHSEIQLTLDEAKLIFKYSKTTEPFYDKSRNYSRQPK